MQTLKLKKPNTHTYANHLAFIPKKLSTAEITELDAFYDRVEDQRQVAFDEDNWQMFVDASARDRVPDHTPSADHKSYEVIPAWFDASRQMTEEECNSRCWAGWIQRGGYYR